MTKVDLMRRILEPVVTKALSDQYGLKPDSITEKQMGLIDQIWEGIYEKFSPHLGIKELKEILGEKDG